MIPRGATGPVSTPWGAARSQLTRFYQGFDNNKPEMSGTWLCIWSHEVHVVDLSSSLEPLSGGRLTCLPGHVHSARLIFPHSLGMLPGVLFPQIQAREPEVQRGFLLLPASVFCSSTCPLHDVLSQEYLFLSGETLVSAPGVGLYCWDTFHYNVVILT